MSSSSAQSHDTAEASHKRKRTESSTASSADAAVSVSGPSSAAGGAAAAVAGHITRLAAVEVQLIMRCCDLQTLLKLARCNRFMRQCFLVDFARQLLPPIELRSQDCFSGARWSDALLRLPGLHLLWVLSDAEDDLSHGVRNVATLPPVRALTLSCPTEQDEEELLSDESKCTVFREALQGAGHLASLTSLVTENLDIINTGANFLVQLVDLCPRLKVFAQRFSYVEDTDALRLLPTLERCASLDSLGVTVHSGGAETLSSFLDRTGPRLRELALGADCGGRVLAKLLRSLRSCAGLTRLELNELSMTTEHSNLLVESLESMPLLQSLEVSYCFFEEVDAFVSLLRDLALSVAGRLTALNLDGYGVKGAEASAALLDLLRRAENVRDLSLSQHAMDDAAFAAVLGAVGASHAMRRLCVVKNSFGPASLAALAGALQNSRTLLSLEADECALGDADALVLAPSLALSCLTHITLGENLVRSAGGVAIAQAVAASSSLRSVRLSGNPIGDVAGSAFATSMQQCKTLDTLKLSKCQLTDNSLVALATALPTSSLHLFFLTNNTLAAAGGTAFASAILHAPLLRRLEFGRNFLSDLPGERNDVLLALARRPHISYKS